MIPVVLILAGLGAIVGAAFLISLPVGLAALGCALIFTGIASVPRPKPPKE